MNPRRGYKSGIILILISLIGGLFFGFILSEVNRGEQLNLLTSYQPTTPTRLYDINGIPFAELYRHKQELLRFQDIPPHVVNAFLSVEDTNFYNHFGIDFLAILRAAWVNVIHMKIKQGGSTITQQLSKRILKNSKKSFTRKFIEALLTLQIEQEYSKEEILEIYFNLVYLGHGTTGLSSAASVYFSKDVRDLDVAEGALLARLPKAPVQYSPFKNPMQAKRAHKMILNLMVENGFFPEDQVDEVHDAFWEKYWPIVITKSPSSSTWGTKLDRAPYFTEHIRKQLIKELGDELVYTGGLKVYTTLDISKQEIAEEELLKALVSYDKTSFGASLSYKGGADTSLVSIYNLLGSVFPVAGLDISKFDDSANFRVALENELIESLDILSITSPIENEASAIGEFRKRTAIFTKNLHVEGAVITIEPATGYIQVMVGGTKFTPKNQFNRAMLARRQTGSAFKPFVYGAAIHERVIGTGTGLMDAPITSISDEGQSWAPEGITGQYMGMIPASRALALSLNIVSVQVLYRVGEDAIIDFASRLMKLGPNRLVKNPTLALGVAELSPYEMALGYSIFSNKGRDVIPFTLRYIIDQSGSTIYNKETEIRKQLAEKSDKGELQVIPESSAYIVRKLLQNVADNGTPSTALRNKDWANYHGKAGGKTGSTSSYTNAWYCGFDPKYTTVVWIGYDKNSISLGRGMTAALIAAPIWGHIYRRWYEGKEYPDFTDENGKDPVPEGVIAGGTCAYNGLSPKPGVCPTISNYYLKPITENGVTKAYKGDRQCDGDRDHSKTMDFRDFLQREMAITDEEIGKKGRYFKSKND
ncbi:MAG: transglycosylase domain-containing protein [Leptospiraceae bacterium]|nr:transglycosylase domain-containing protein [Leptospiraceae bacterium]MCP5511424.1 transglycosylase domain-containing protein [Leptospiraceae bacterium]